MKKGLIIAVIVLIIIATAGILAYKFNQKGADNGAANIAVTDKKTEVENSQSVYIPEKVLANKFGFLGGGQGKDNPFVGNAGGAWVRPHPGPFLWDAMQESADGKIDFSKTDEVIKNQQAQNYGTLVTLWPFAEWDQKMGNNYKNCAVSAEDEFLSRNDKKGRMDYLPLHRCNPISWEKYKQWASAVVERYDGDGTNDLPNLKIPVKYWEVMNEPDLSYMSDSPDADRLCFYRQGPKEYAELLIKTAEAIRSADKDAKVLISGAAGADTRFLNFYRQALAVGGTGNAFDIGNVHCISNDQGTNDFNAGAYKKMLTALGINKPIWVTEAESFNGKTAEENYNFTKKSTAGAIAAGAERIFYTRYNFDDFRKDMSQKNVESKDSAKKSEQWYLEITSLY
jgi:hypothetical protein